MVRAGEGEGVLTFRERLFLKRNLGPLKVERPRFSKKGDNRRQIKQYILYIPYLLHLVNW